VWDAGRAAIDHIEAVCREERLEADFARVPGYLFALRAEDRDQIEHEARQARELGYVADVVDDAVFPPMRHGAMRLAGQARFHPRKYLLQLAERLHAAGCRIFTGCHVDGWSGGGGKPWRITAGGRVLQADHLVFATHQPIHDRLYAARVPAYQTYAAAWRVPRGTFGDALAWDTADPYHYWRLTPAGDHDLLIVGGEDHRTGQADAEAAYGRLISYVEGVLGKAPHTLAWRWSGQWLEPVDGAPYVGRVPGHANAYLGTGYGGNGMTMGTYAGLAIADLIQGRERPDLATFDPGRLNLRAGAVTFLTENLAYPAYLLRDRLGPAERTTVDALAPGDGAVVELAGDKVAASRDDDGKLHMVSAVCTHMGCVVHWNGAEKSWDCPCHGSRFMPDGAVMNGPATQALPPCRAARREGAET
jgi:glycine/D-amino acid oxidase-like deaminating enzyme/nitrite reductase/ring-hydroxylating ferredoxin subunit